METIGKIITTLNTFMDKSLPWIALAGLLYFNLLMLLRLLHKNLKPQSRETNKESLSLWVSSFGRSIYLLIFSLIMQITLLTIFYFSHPILRWVEVYACVSVLILFTADKRSRQRGIYTALGHITILLIGWLIGSWLGIFFISGTLFFVFYYWLYRLALVILPASDPDNFNESIQRFKMLAWYLWGLQFPVWVVKDHAGRIIEERIPGDAFKTFGLPGVIWTHSNQAVGITAGTRFSRVEGPGLVYTRPYERPYEIVDLRTQIRASFIDAISQDGIPYQALLLAVFGIDKEDWKDEEYHAMRLKNTLLRGAQKPDRNAGSYRYSRGRITAALSVQGVMHSFEGKETDPIIRWDQWALATVQEAARKELSRRSLDELWRPAKDEQDINALDLIGASIRHSIYPILKANGIHLFTARIVNFHFDNENAAQVLNQQIENWKSFMDQDISQMKSKAEAKSVKIREDALAYARSTLLASIAEGLNQITETHNGLPKKYIIAVRFLGAIEDWLRKQPPTEVGEANGKLESFHSRVRSFIPSTQRF